MRTLLTAVLAPALLLAGCDAPQEQPADIGPQDAFWNALQTHCGNAYRGGLVSDDEVDADMQGAEMLMHVRTCDEERITIPFHIKPVDGEWNRSRTWVLTKTQPDGFRLKHDHRHEDGESDDVTMYGGDTAESGTARTQSFPVDQESIDMFKQEGLDVSVTNVWSVTIDPAETENAIFVYQLERTVEGGAPEPRMFRVEFDLTSPIKPPPAPWGF